MLISNPFSAVAEFLPNIVIQGYIILMILLVIGGTLLDVIHKKSAQYFFENAKKSQEQAKRKVDSGEKASLAIKTLTNEVLTSSEFCNQKRRISHLFTMYGFVIFVVTTAIMIFGYLPPADSTPAIWPLLWHLGALMLCFGGYWFWFFIRVDVNSEGLPWYRFERADIFIVSLITMATFGLIWSFFQWLDVAALSTLFFVLFLISTTTLFSTVLWSKFAHMFFKPAAAYQKRVTRADGSREGLPEMADRTNPADRDRHSMELLKDAPLDMGLGIKREAPNHY